MRRLSLLAFALGSAGCMALPPSSMERLSQSAYDLNTATRFGRMDIAAENVAVEAKSDFGRRHRAWGRELRIVDLELEGVQMLGSDSAEVNLIVSWHRLDDATIHSSLVAQRWTQTSADWKLVEETIASGPPGLFPPPKPKDAERPGEAKRRELLGSVDVP
ncbi:MAG: hypothetical protein FJ095_14945 [Deltaproteobacteria bacterium]|nr:hypothetical protein [Deltaproteobacteria bacterium]